MNLTIAGIALAVAAALGGAGSWKVTQLHYLSVISDEHEKLAVAQESDRLRDRAAATQYETWKAAQRPKDLVVKRGVEREVKADLGCSMQPLPIGLRDSIAAAVANSNLGIADPAVPAASAATTHPVR